MNQLFSIRGRLGRSRYQNHYLLVLGGMVLLLSLYELGKMFGLADLAMQLAVLGITVSFVSMISAAIRRLHDLDRPAWHLIMAFMPVYNLYLLLSLLCTRGEQEHNRYGLRPEPLNS